ncbi:hypothetical protein [Lysobacter gummosus]
MRGDLRVGGVFFQGRQQVTRQTHNDSRFLRPATLNPTTAPQFPL